MSWRDRANIVIEKVIGSRVVRTMTPDEKKALRKELSAAYPFGAREYHPYKIWCDAVKLRLGPDPAREKPMKTPVWAKGTPELFDSAGTAGKE